MEVVIASLEGQVEDLTTRLEETTKQLEESRVEGENTYKTLKETVTKKT